MKKSKSAERMPNSTASPPLIPQIACVSNDSFGAKLMRLSGWTGGGLGREGKGIAGDLLPLPHVAALLLRVCRCCVILLLPPFKHFTFAHSHLALVPEPVNPVISLKRHGLGSQSGQGTTLEQVQHAHTQAHTHTNTHTYAHTSTHTQQRTPTQLARMQKNSRATSVRSTKCSRCPPHVIICTSQPASCVVHCMSRAQRCAACWSAFVDSLCAASSVPSKTSSKTSSIQSASNACRGGINCRVIPIYQAPAPASPRTAAHTMASRI